MYALALLSVTVGSRGTGRVDLSTPFIVVIITLYRCKMYHKALTIIDITEDANGDAMLVLFDPSNQCFYVQTVMRELFKVCFRDWFIIVLTFGFCVWTISFFFSFQLAATLDSIAHSDWTLFEPSTMQLVSHLSFQSTVDSNEIQQLKMKVLTNWGKAPFVRFEFEGMCHTFVPWYFWCNKGTKLMAMSLFLIRTEGWEEEEVRIHWLCGLVSATTT